MAEPAHPYGLPQALSPPKDIKEEVQNILDGLDFSMPNEDDMVATGSGEPSNSLDESHNQQDRPTQNQAVSQAPEQNNGLAHAGTPAAQPHQFTGSPQATKRQLEDGTPTQESQAKRVKTETEPEAEAEPSFEDGLALLVQNALDSANNMMDGSQVGESRGEAELSARNHEGFPESDSMAFVEATPAPAMSLMPPSFSFTEEPERFVRTVNVRALGNLSLSLLLILCQELSEEMMPKIRDFSSGHAGAFLQLRVSFEAVRGLVSRETYISADELGIEDADSRRILDFANMARLAIWLVEGGSKYLAELDRNFLSLFGTQISDLPPGMSHLYMEIKTQRALEAIAAKDSNRTTEEITKGIFVDGLEEKLKAQHNGTELTDADDEFLKDAKARQQELSTHETNSISSLKEKYPSEVLLRTFSTYIKGRLAASSDLGIKLGIALPTVEEVGVEESQPQNPDPVEEMDLDDLSSFFEKTTSGLVQSALAGFNSEARESTENAADQSNGDVQMNGNDDYMSDYQALEALVAESTSNYVRNTLDGLTPAPYQPTVPQSTAEAMAAPNNQSHYLEYNHQQTPDQYYSYAQQPIQEQQQQQQQAQPQGPPGTNLPPNQTFPSAILYDKARQAALSKTSQHTRREGLHSTRRPWTQEEEKALMAGLDMVKGPHWSQILTLFGANGTISDILKDRTQVQLKDKARNLKLFFLKTNSEMPYYLQAVTGELKTRAPTQAARKEAEERARLTSEEDQAKLQGIMALAGGLQHPPQNRPSGSPAKNIMQNVVTPAQAASAAAHAAAQRNKMVAQGTTTGAASHGVASANTPRSVLPGTQYHTQPVTHSNIRPQGHGLPSTRPSIPQVTQGTQSQSQQPSSSQAPAVMQTTGQPKPQTHQAAQVQPQGQTQGQQMQHQTGVQPQSQPLAQTQSSPGQQVLKTQAQAQQTQPGVIAPRPTSNQVPITPTPAPGRTTPSTPSLSTTPAISQKVPQPQQPGQAQAQARSDGHGQGRLAQPARQALQPASAPQSADQVKSQQHQRSSPGTSAPAHPAPATQVQQSDQTQASPSAQSALALQAHAAPKQSQSQEVQTSNGSSTPPAHPNQQQTHPQSLLPPGTVPTPAPTPVPATLSEPPQKDRIVQSEVQPATKDDEDSSEAALMKGLQAAIAEATS